MAPSLLGSLLNHASLCDSSSSSSVRHSFIIEGARRAARFLTVALGTQVALTSRPHDAHTQTSIQTSSADGAKLGAVASENAICTDIGTGLLRAGGNAADALVATVFCVGVTGMYHSGIGGGG